ncbi:MAG: hypothetical protein Q8O88_01535 [bacterium]|nr:hypothetical protein [bacterium]
MKTGTIDELLTGHESDRTIIQTVQSYGIKHDNVGNERYILPTAQGYVCVVKYHNEHDFKVLRLYD